VRPEPPVQAEAGSEDVSGMDEPKNEGRRRMNEKYRIEEAERQRAGAESIGDLYAKDNYWTPAS
jgi:hypothetical protein